MRYSATSACFQIGPSLRFAGEEEVSNEPELGPIEGVGGKRWAKTFPPTPKLTQDVRGILTHIKASQARSLGLCVGNSLHNSNLTYLFFQILPSTYRTNFDPNSTIITKKISYPMVCSGQETVR